MSRRGRFGKYGDFKRKQLIRKMRLTPEGRLPGTRMPKGEPADARRQFTRG